MNAVQTPRRSFRALQAQRGFLRWLWALPCFLSFFLLDTAFRAIYAQFGSTTLWSTVPLGFTLAWCLIFTGLAALLPGRWRRVFLLVVAGFFAALAVTDGILINIFRRFHSASDLAYLGDGFKFIDPSYLMSVRKFTVAVAAGCFLLMVAAAWLSPGKTADREPRRVFVGAGAAVLGVLIAISVRLGPLGYTQVLAWDAGTDPAAVYADFSNSRESMLLAGLYQYTFRDLCLSLNLGGGADPGPIRDYLAGRPAHGDNEMTGAFKGKNLILIQLEAIDNWMLTQEYMPALAGVKAQSTVFENHYSPAFITAGTFNTEFMVNTGLFPAGTGTPVSVYTRNAYPNALARLMSETGYTARSFHGSEGDVYNRGGIHPVWGFEDYNGGSAMGMEDYTMDACLMSGCDQFTQGDPFFSFIITFSGHGPYNMESSASAAHYGAAKALVGERQPDNYIHAVAHAMETDAFIEALMERLEADGLLENTVLAFYADHYNYYMLNDAQVMEIKGAENLNMLQHTDFFIYSADREPQRVSKATATIDVLPTLANLFGLPADYSAYLGDDAFGDTGGYVIFQDSAWYDGTRYAPPGEDPARDAEIDRRLGVGQDILRSDYFKK